MKKILCILLSVIMVFCLSGCAQTGNSGISDGAAGANGFGASDSAESLPEYTVGITAEPEETTLKPETTTSKPEETTSKPETTPTEGSTPTAEEESPLQIDENGSYTSRDDVALYIHTYGRLPQNFITKKEAQELGWSGGSLEPYAPGKCIGGSHFGNYEGLLPEKEGRSYTECDIDTLGQKSRGAKRIVFSNDGLIYYTDDHYESFTLLYGEE